MKRNLLMRISKILKIRKIEEFKVDIDTLKVDYVAFINKDPSKKQVVYFEVIQPERWEASYSITVDSKTYHKEHIGGLCKIVIPKGIDEIKLVLYGDGKCTVSYESSKLLIPILDTSAESVSSIGKMFSNNMVVPDYHWYHGNNIE